MHGFDMTLVRLCHDYSITVTRSICSIIAKRYCSKFEISWHRIQDVISVSTCKWSPNVPFDYIQEIFAFLFKSFIILSNSLFTNLLLFEQSSYYTSSNIALNLWGISKIEYTVH